MQTVAIQISLQLVDAPTEEGVVQLKQDVKRYLSHMLDVARIDGVHVQKTDVAIDADEQAHVSKLRAQRRTSASL